MGKTVGGAVWLDPNKTSPYDFYQYWRNVNDADVIKCLKMLTFLPLEQIAEMEKWEGAQLNRAKEILAYELTALVHSKEDAEKSQETARALFASGGAAEMPTAEIEQADFVDGAIDVLTLLVKTGLCPSKSEARRNVTQGGVEVNGEKVTDIATTFPAEAFVGEGLVVKRGKKTFKKAVLKG
jgi:tyrosyl-tRNA synthetase